MPLSRCRARYTTIYAVTLIALLRIGLVTALRQRFYAQFVRLPLYEDMAPWNIVLQASQHAYTPHTLRREILRYPT